MVWTVSVEYRLSGTASRMILRDHITQHNPNTTSRTLRMNMITLSSFADGSFTLLQFVGSCSCFRSPHTCTHIHIPTPKGSGWCKLAYHFYTHNEDKRTKTYSNTIQDLFGSPSTVSGCASTACLGLLPIERSVVEIEANFQTMDERLVKHTKSVMSYLCTDGPILHR